MEEEENKNQILGRKAKYYFDNGLKIHVVLNTARKYSNGIITYIGSDFIMFSEDNSKFPEPLFFIEIIDILPFREKAEKLK